MRQERKVDITAPGRDIGRSYLITEMPASQAERWASRLFLSLAKNGLDGAPMEIMGLGWAGIALMGVHGLAGVAWNEAEPLLEEMMGCVQIIAPSGARRLMEEDIEEVATRLQLRGEVLAMHLNFSLTEALSHFRELMKAPVSLNIPTSPEPSEPSSQAD